MIADRDFGMSFSLNLKLVNVTSSRLESSVFIWTNPGFSSASFLSALEIQPSHIQISVDHFIFMLSLIAGIMSASPLTITIFPLVTLLSETSAVISATI